MRDDVSLFLDGVPAPSQATIEWITSIRKLLKTNPKLVAPYIYHMFLGLYSGGKILRHKFKLKGKHFFFNSLLIEIFRRSCET